jgi:hypothetical protein
LWEEKNTEQKQKKETQGIKSGSHSSDHSFVGSSACYGGPDENYDSVKEKTITINKVLSKLSFKETLKLQFIVILN